MACRGSWPREHLPGRSARQTRWSRFRWRRWRPASCPWARGRRRQCSPWSSHQGRRSGRTQLPDRWQRARRARCAQRVRLAATTPRPPACVATRRERGRASWQQCRRAGVVRSGCAGQVAVSACGGRWWRGMPDEPRVATSTLSFHMRNSWGCQSWDGQRRSALSASPLTPGL